MVNMREYPHDEEGYEISEFHGHPPSHGYSNAPYHSNSHSYNNLPLNSPTANNSPPSNDQPYYGYGQQPPYQNTAYNGHGYYQQDNASVDQFRQPSSSLLPQRPPRPAYPGLGHYSASSWGSSFNTLPVPQYESRSETPVPRSGTVTPTTDRFPPTRQYGGPFDSPFDSRPPSEVSCE